MGITLGRSANDGEDIRDDGEDIGEVREDEEDIAGLPCLCLEMSWKPVFACLRCWGRHVFRVSPEMLEKTLGDVGEDIREDGDDMSSLSSLRCWGSHVFPVFLEMSGETCLQYLP